MSETDWRAEARKWEQRAKANGAEVARLKEELSILAARERGWREAMSALNTNLLDRLDRVTEALTTWEPTNE